jgi:hypothetical protein
MKDDDKVFEKTMNLIMIGGGILASTLIIASAYDAGYQSAKNQAQPTIIHGNYTVNNSINLNSSDAGSVSK